MTSAGGFAPWAGLVIGLIAWFANQQAGVSLVAWRCTLGHPTPLLLLGLATLVSAGRRPLAVLARPELCRGGRYGFGRRSPVHQFAVGLAGSLPPHQVDLQTGIGPAGAEIGAAAELPRDGRPTGSDPAT